MNFLSLDVGTTCTKVQVFNECGDIIFYDTRECSLKSIAQNQYADIDTIVATVKELIKNAAQSVEIDSIAISSFGESFVALDKNDNILFYPMLYTDNRGEKESKNISLVFSEEKVFSITGTVPHAMYSVSKLLWIKANEPAIYSRIDKVLLICDYLGYILTGKRVIDYSLAARTGLFDIKNKVFSCELLNALSIPEYFFSEPRPTGSVVGNVKREVAQELGLSDDCKIILGSHDQVCATIGAGIIENSQSADGMGTVECITAVFNTPIEDISFGKKGYCVVPFLENLYCTYILNYTNNSIVNWLRKDVMHGYSGDFESQFDYLEKSASLTDVIILPYFAGCSTPFQDGNAKGAFLNLTTQTKDVDLYRAILEGTSFEMKLNLEVCKDYGIKVADVVATGGGANSTLWLQIKSDILGVPIKTLRSSEGGLCGLAMLSSVAMGLCKDLQSAKEIFVKYKKFFSPENTYKTIYDEKYKKYKKLYHTLKEFN